MQRQLTYKTVSTSGKLCCRLPPTVVLRRQRPPRPQSTTKASGQENAPEQPASSSSSSSKEVTAASGTSNVVEATVLEPGTGQAEAEASTSGAPTETDLQLLDFPEPSPSANRAAGVQYGALGGLYALASGAVAVAALRAPQALLPAATAADPWAATLLGCLAVTYLRAAGVSFHLNIAAINGELLCMRHQRLALTTAAFGVVALASQALGVASLQLAGLQLVLAVASCAVVANVARGVWSVRPFVSVVEAAADGTPGGAAGVMLRAALDVLSTVAGVLLLGIMASSLYGFCAVVLSAAPAPPAPLGSWPGQVAALDPAAAGLRRLVGCGLLLLAAQAHALLDFADSVRPPPDVGSLAGFRRFMVEHIAQTQDRLSKYYLPDPRTYRVLNFTFVLAAILQAYLVVAAPGLGVNVNWDGALWGPMYGTWALSLLYGLVGLLSVDWASVVSAVLDFTAWCTSLVLDFFNAFVWKFEWAERVRRK